MNRFKLLGVITNNPHAVFQRNVIAGMTEIANHRGYHVEVVTVTELPHDFEALQTNARQWHGALVIANVLPEPYLRQFEADGLPVSQVANFNPNLNFPTIMSNNRQGIQILMKHLVNDCHRRQPVFICGDLHQNDGLQRRNAFEQEVMLYDLEVPAHYYLKGDFEPAVAQASLRAFLQRGEPFDSIVASDYLMANVALEVLAEAQIAVPRQVSVIGFGDGVEAEATRLTTIAADIIELGRRGTRQLLGQVEGLEIRGLTLLSTELVIRATSV